jgi:hypothetical protein
MLEQMMSSKSESRDVQSVISHTVYNSTTFRIQNTESTVHRTQSTHVKIVTATVTATVITAT